MASPRPPFVGKVKLVFGVPARQDVSGAAALRRRTDDGKHEGH